jgi:GNAT superfamily N-acetyltransferase
MITQERIRHITAGERPGSAAGITITEPLSVAEWDAARALVSDMFSWIVDGVGVRIEDVQASAAAEIDDLPGSYPPGEGVFLVARRHGEVVGTSGVLRIAPGVVELKRMYIRPDARGHGIAQMLLREAIERGRELGGRIMRLETHATFMHTAYKMYLSFGFRPRADYSGLTLDVPGVVAMERRIDIPDAMSA